MDLFRKAAIAGSLLGITLVLGAAGGQGGCAQPADVASRNISIAADNFEINRKITFINGITDKYLLLIEGRCSIGNNDGQGKLSITCMTGPSEYRKHYLGLSDNVTFVAEQLDAVDVSTFHYRVSYRPQTIIPDIDLQIDTDELTTDRY